MVHNWEPSHQKLPCGFRYGKVVFLLVVLNHFYFFMHCFLTTALQWIRVVCLCWFWWCIFKRRGWARRALVFHSSKTLGWIQGGMSGLDLYMMAMLLWLGILIGMVIVCFYNAMKAGTDLFIVHKAYVEAIKEGP